MMTSCCNRRLSRGALALLLAVALAAPAPAETIAITTSVTRTLATDDGRYGGCMVGLGVSPAAEGLDCPAARWVTFSCVGEHASKSSALRMYDSAQMAFALGRKVVVHVDDTKKHNGWCFASRIDVLRSSATKAATAMTHAEASAEVLD